MAGMNWEQVKGVLERLLTMAFMYAAGKGWIPADIVGSLVTIAVSVGSVIWGLKVNTQSSLVQATAALPSVEKVVVTGPEMAANLTQPGAKVTTS